MKRMIEWIFWALFAFGGLTSTPVTAQLAVAVVSDVPETMTNVRRYQQYVLQAQQFLEEAEYWSETGQQLYRVIDRLGSPNSFWSKVDSLLDGVSLAGKVSSEQEWGSEWYPDEYLRMARASSDLGLSIEEMESEVKGNRDIERVIGRTRYILGSTVANSIRTILEEMGKQDEQREQRVRQILEEPVSDEEGVAGLMEKQQALQSMGLSTQGTTNALLKTLLQAQAEQFAQHQLNRLEDAEYQQAERIGALRRQYESRHEQLNDYRRRVEEEMERQRTGSASGIDTLPQPVRFSLQP